MLMIGSDKVFIGDVHIHTFYSDGHDSPEKVVERAMALGYDFIAITDHDNPAGSIEAKNIVNKNKLDLLVIEGMEVSTTWGHVIALGLRKKMGILWEPETLMREIRRMGGVSIAAHPCWKDTKEEFWDSKLFHSLTEKRVFDCFELINSGVKSPVIDNSPVVDFYHALETLGVEYPITSGSDAHKLEAIGKSKMFVFASRPTKDEILKAILDRKCVVEWDGVLYGPGAYKKQLLDGDYARQYKKLLKARRGSPPLIVSRNAVVERKVACSECHFKTAKPRSVPDMTRISHVTFPSSWSGRGDLSGAFSLLWDEENFHLNVEVVDDIHCQPYRGGKMFEGDSVQFGFDPLCLRETCFGKVYEYTMGLTDTGSQLYRGAAPYGIESELLIDDMALDIARPQEGVTSYALTLPWRQLKPFDPKSHDRFGFSIIVNDNDGKGRKNWIFWGNDLGIRKYPKGWAVIEITGREVSPKTIGV